MNEVLTALQKPLDIADIEFRVGSLRGKNPVYSTFLAYKNARVDMKRLDEATGGLWQNEYRRDSKGILQCGIGIKFGDEWVWKWSNGTESNQEAEKGEYSDAFKRAGFMWGIGRELYDFPEIFAQLVDGEFESDGQKARATYKLKPNEWTWTVKHGDTIEVTAKDKTGKLRFSTKGSTGAQAPSEPAQTTTAAPRPPQDIMPYSLDRVYVADNKASRPPVKVDAFDPTALSWEEVVIGFGKNAGKKLGELPPTSLSWYAEKWEPTGPNDGIVKAAAIYGYSVKNGTFNEPPTENLADLPF